MDQTEVDPLRYLPYVGDNCGNNVTHSYNTFDLSYTAITIVY